MICRTLDTDGYLSFCFHVAPQEQKPGWMCQTSRLSVETLFESSINLISRLWRGEDRIRRNSCGDGGGDGCGDGGGDGCGDADLVDVEIDARLWGRGDKVWRDLMIQFPSNNNP
jgi:hypothetical protein